jgi:hypothetical protein
VDISPSGIQLGSGDSIQATVSYTGLTLTLQLFDLVTNKTFTYSQAINIPQIVGANTAYVGFTGGTGGLSSSQKLISWAYSTQAVHPAFSPGAGTYSGPQNVTLSSKTPDATMYYTTNGSTPTATSALYTSPIPVSNSLTIKAIAISPMIGTSVVSSSAYVIGSSVGPLFTLAGNSFTITWRGGSLHEPVSVTPSGGFTGRVPLTCSVTGPAGAMSIPTCTVSTQPATISGAVAVTGYVFVQTQASTTIGNYTLKVQGTYGATTQSVNIPFTVN